MAGASIAITVEDAAVRQGLQQLAAHLADLSPAMDEIGAAMVSSTLLRFQSGTAPGGAAWAPSARARKEGGQTLVESSRLRGSITHSADADSVEIGTNVIYAAIHQFGGQIQKHAHSAPIYRRQADVADGGPARFVKRSKADFMTWHEVKDHTIDIPARPFLGVDVGDEAEIAAILRRRIAEILP